MTRQHTEHQGIAGGGSDGNYTSLHTATLDGLGAVGDGAHAEHEFLYIDKTLERAALRENLKVMDATAIVLCRDNGIPMRVMNIYEPGALMRLVSGEEIGSLVESGD